MRQIKSVLSVFKVAFFLILETPFRPRWAYHRARGFFYNYVLNRYHQSRVSEFETRLQPLNEALASSTGCSEEEVIEAGRSKILERMEVQNRWVVDLHYPGEEEHVGNANEKGPIEIFYGPSPELMKACNIVTRLLKPEVVLESGVAKGFTSAAILDALEENGRGKLYSVEMPSLHIGYKKQVGERIPKALRKRWSLSLGPSAVVLPSLVETLGQVDLFVYDSAISYDNQRSDFGIITRAMRTGGVIIANQIVTDALIEVAEANNCRWTTTIQTKEYPIGLLTKLG